MGTLKNITEFLNNETLLNQSKLDKVFELLYPEVKRIANSQLAKILRNSDVTPTLLVNECYLRLKHSVSLDLKNRKHFFSIASRCMRFYLVDLIRKQYNLKSKNITEFSISKISTDDKIAIDLMELDHAFNKLEKMDAELLNIVELRFFGGFSLKEIAKLLDINTTKVYRQWLLAKSILVSFLEEAHE